MTIVRRRADIHTFLSHTPPDSVDTAVQLQTSSLELRVPSVALLPQRIFFFGFFYVEGGGLGKVPIVKIFRKACR